MDGAPLGRLISEVVEALEAREVVGAAEVNARRPLALVAGEEAVMEGVGEEEGGHGHEGEQEPEAALWVHRVASWVELVEGGDLKGARVPARPLLKGLWADQLWAEGHEGEPREGDEEGHPRDEAEEAEGG